MMNKQTRRAQTFPTNTGSSFRGSSPLPLHPHFLGRQKKGSWRGTGLGCPGWVQAWDGSWSRASPGEMLRGPGRLSGSVGRWLIAPVNHRAAPRSTVYFSDSNLVLALFHTCHRVFFLTLEACRKRTVINGAIHPGGGSFITL